MKNILCAILFISAFAFNTYCQADEREDHTCFRTVDKNGDGAVDFQEFKYIFGEDREKFNSIDRDNDGVLTHDEYHRSLGHGS